MEHRDQHATGIGIAAIRQSLDRALLFGFVRRRFEAFEQRQGVAIDACLRRKTHPRAAGGRRSDSWAVTAAPIPATR